MENINQHRLILVKRRKNKKKLSEKVKKILNSTTKLKKITKIEKKTKKCVKKK